MDFSEALLYLKRGWRLQRRGWNGKDMYITLMRGYPNGVTANEPTRKAHHLDEGAEVVIQPYIVMRMADGSLMPWTAAHIDLLSTDWQFFNDGKAHQEMLDLAAKSSKHPENDGSY